MGSVEGMGLCAAPLHDCEITATEKLEVGKCLDIMLKIPKQCHGAEQILLAISSLRLTQDFGIGI